jgi:hypothetical protein
MPCPSHSNTSGVHQHQTVVSEATCCGLDSHHYLRTYSSIQCSGLTFVGVYHHVNLHCVMLRHSTTPAFTWWLMCYRKGFLRLRVSKKHLQESRETALIATPEAALLHRNVGVECARHCSSAMTYMHIILGHHVPCTRSYTSTVQCSRIPSVQTALHGRSPWHFCVFFPLTVIARQLGVFFVAAFEELVLLQRHVAWTLYAARHPDIPFNF